MRKIAEVNIKPEVTEKSITKVFKMRIQRIKRLKHQITILTDEYWYEIYGKG